MTRRYGKLIDGHSPLTSGAELSAYALSGVDSDHECSTENEVQERISRGMTKTGHIHKFSQTKNLWLGNQFA